MAIFSQNTFSRSETIVSLQQAPIWRRPKLGALIERATVLPINIDPEY